MLRSGNFNRISQSIDQVRIAVNLAPIVLSYKSYDQLLSTIASILYDNYQSCTSGQIITAMIRCTVLVVDIQDY